MYHIFEQNMNELVNRGKNSAEVSLVSLPTEVLQQILSRLDGISLGRLECVCRRFKLKQGSCNLSVCEKAAKRKLTKLCGRAQAGRWWQHKWQERLYIETQFTGFDPEGWQLGFQYAVSPCSRIGVEKIQLTQNGPRLLVSDFSSFNNNILRWRFKVEGENPALEIGVVPLALQRFQEALHKAYLHMGSCVCEVATGIKSHPTENSHLSYEAAMDSGCIVEIIAKKGFVEVRVDPPEACQNFDSDFDFVQQRCQHFEMRFPQAYDVKLAATCWPNTRLEVLYHEYGE
eukprot:TRINITY_DN615_c0_g1_i1.p1 TRINITY_DN615_c0_g1~~TRINITY_DN615_c0_g1_i1.p1  ORF type:complete len:287 (-),score=17.72 TRINITY_DN615_c0_g1_i1:306-1166(-)